MGGAQILLVAAVILIPLAIAVVVTLWTLEPAAQRAERAKRGRKRSQSVDLVSQLASQAPLIDGMVEEDAARDDRTTDLP